MDISATVESVLGKEKTEEEIEKKLADFHGLLTREVALKLIAKEQGLIKEEPIKISEIKPGMKRVTVQARIIRINQLVQYPNGKKTRGMLIKDDSGIITITVWNEDTELLSKLKTGDEIRIKNAYERLGSITLGYQGSLELVTAAPYTPLDQLHENNTVHVRGTILRIQGSRTYEKNKAQKEYFIFSISDGKNEIRCVVWDQVERTKRLTAGDEIIIQNATVRKNEIHINATSRLLARKQEHLISGKLTEIYTKGTKLVLSVGERSLTFNRENALKFLGITVNKDIEIETIVQLKKEVLLNSIVHIRCKEHEKEWIMV